MESSVIDNCVITKLVDRNGTGLRICPIRLSKKLYPLINTDTLRKVSFGSRKHDNYAITNLINGELTYNDVAGHC
jgi:hypothetical protein